MVFGNGTGISFIERDKEAQKGVGTSFHPSVSINNHTFRGEYEKPNDIFKVICQSLKKKPAICSSVNIEAHHYQDERKVNPKVEQMKDKLAVYKEYKKEDDKLAGMERRADLADILLALIMVGVMITACILYCKMYNKKKTNDRMQLEVNESVTQYFALASKDPSERSNTQSMIDPS